MIARNVAVVMQNQKTAAAIPPEDKEAIQKKGVKAFVADEFGLKKEAEAESAIYGLMDVAGEPEKKTGKKAEAPAAAAAPAADTAEHKHWWSSDKKKSE